MVCNAFKQNSDKLSKNAIFKTAKIGLAGRLGLHNKKAPQRVHNQKWCEILCNYRTNFYDDFKQLCHKMEMVKTAFHI